MILLASGEFSSSDVHAYINSVGILVTVVLGGFAFFGRLANIYARVCTVEVKVNELWAFQFRRGVAEATQRGLMEVHSPARLIGGSGQMLEHMADELRAYYKAHLSNLGEVEAGAALEKKFGARLTVEVCIPNNITLGACLVMALAIAKDADHSLSEILNHTLPKTVQEKKDEGKKS